MNTVPVLTQAVGIVPAAARVVICGLEAADVAVACMLSMSGHQVWVPAEARNLPGSCKIVSRVEQSRPIIGQSNLIAADPQGLKASHIIISSAATEYGAIAAKIGPSLNGGETVILCQAPLGASFQLWRELNRVNPGVQPTIMEAGALFDFAEIQGNEVVISGLRRKINCCGRTRNETHRGLVAMSELWTGLVPACNILERGFFEIEQILTPVVRLFRLLGSESDLPPAALDVVAALSAEVQTLARAYRLVLPEVSQLLADYGDFSSGSIARQLQDLQTLVLRPTCQNTVECRELLAQEIEQSVVLLEGLARVARVQVPALDAVIKLSSVVIGHDLYSSGRSLDELGLVGLDVAEIIEAVNA